MTNEESSSKWGFVSPDGHFQNITNLSVQNLEFASKSLDELKLLLDKYVGLEQYEKCCILRDEIIKRSI
jgi:hypothetical protein